MVWKPAVVIFAAVKRRPSVFRQKVKFTIDWTHRNLFIITIISELILREVNSFTKILQAASFTSQLHIWVKGSITAAC